MDFDQIAFVMKYVGTALKAAGDVLVTEAEKDLKSGAQLAKLSESEVAGSRKPANKKKVSKPAADDKISTKKSADKDAIPVEMEDTSAADIPEDFPLLDDIQSARRPQLCKWVDKFLPKVTTDNLVPQALKAILVRAYYPDFIRDVCSEEEEEVLLGGDKDSVVDKKDPKKGSTKKSSGKKNTGKSEEETRTGKMADDIIAAIASDPAKFKSSIDEMGCGADCHNCPNPDNMDSVEDMVLTCHTAIVPPGSI